MSIPQVNMV